ncbi:hypothetical protein, partial [Roseovarius Plymouth podovirus 1]
MYRLQFPADGSVQGCGDLNEIWDLCLSYGPSTCEIQVYCPDFGVWVKINTQPKEEAV